MIILIDAYNLIKHVVGRRDATKSEISFFKKKLKQYSQKSKNVVVMIFDGGDSNFTTLAKEENFEIVYSGYKLTADDVIKKYLKKLNPDNSLLVTSDLELVGRAKAKSIESISSNDFYEDVLKERIIPQTKNQLDPTLYKINESDSDLDELMESYSKKIQLKKEDFEKSKNFTKSDKLSKKESKRLKILKKL